MKKLFFYSIILSSFIFTNCKKEDNQPSHNRLVIVDRNGNTTTTPPLTVTDISGSFDPSFGGSAKTSSGDYSFSIGVFKGYTPSNITFDATSPNYGVAMWFGGRAAGSWVSTAGKADIESKSGSALFGNGGTKFMKVTFNNVQFTINPHTYQTPAPPADTIWISGVVNIYRQ